MPQKFKFYHFFLKEDEEQQQQMVHHLKRETVCVCVDFSQFYIAICWSSS